jgi:peroxiredoxin
MAQLRHDYQKFIDRQAEVIAAGPEGIRAFTKFWREHKMPFPGIPDPRHVIAKQYGQRIKLLQWGRMPALIVIDKKGKVRYGHWGDSMSDIPTNEVILSMLDGFNKEPA